MHQPIGVLALQGDFAKHIARLKELGADTKEVRTPDDLKECCALILPGGESTTIWHQMEFIGLTNALKAFAKKKPLFGTCAGLILMSKTILNEKRDTLDLLDIEVERNAYGRQLDSFSSDVQVEIPKAKKHLPAVFIRAPRIKKWSTDVKVLGKCGREPVLIRQGHHLGATFHPELTDDGTIHRYFLSLIE